MTRPFPQLIQLVDGVTVDIVDTASAIIEQGGQPLIQINTAGGVFTIRIDDVEEAIDGGNPDKVMVNLYMVALLIQGKGLDPVEYDQTIPLDRVLTAETEILPGIAARQVVVMNLTADEFVVL